MLRNATIISRIENHIDKAVDISKKDITDSIIFGALAMECFQAINSATNLAENIISEKKLGVPATYKEIFWILHNAKLINRISLENMKRLIFLRNLISHEYYTITQKELKEMVNLLPTLKQIIKAAK